MKEIVPDVYQLTGPYVGRVYFIRSDDGCTVIDTSIAPAAKAIVAQAHKLGYGPREIRRVLITHAHPDHVGGLPALKAASGAQIYCSSLERPVVEGRTPIPGPPDERLGPLMRRLRPPPTTLKGTPVDHELSDGQIIDGLLGGLQVVATPGHAPGHLSFWAPQRGILFTGDVIFHLGRLGLPFAFFTVDMAENIRSIRRLVDLKPELVCFGHGPPIARNAAKRISAFARKVGAIG